MKTIAVNEQTRILLNVAKSIMLSKNPKIKRLTDNDVVARCAKIYNLTERGEKHE